MSHFVLFCTAEIPIELINDILAKAALPDNLPVWRDENTAYYEFWLATAEWPRVGEWKGMTTTKRNLGVDPEEEAKRDCPAPTIPPFSPDFSSPYIGKTVRECLEILKQAPRDAEVERDRFAVLDAQTAVDGSVLVCEAGFGLAIEGEVFETVRVKPYIAAAVLTALSSMISIDVPQQESIGDGGVLLRFSGRDATKE